MLLGIAAWYLGGVFHFSEYGIIVLLCGILTVLYFTYFEQPFSIHDLALAMFISMVLGYLTALIYTGVKEEDLREKRDSEGGIL